MVNDSSILTHLFTNDRIRKKKTVILISEKEVCFVNRKQIFLKKISVLKGNIPFKSMACYVGQEFTTVSGIVSAKLSCFFCFVEAEYTNVLLSQ